MTKEEDHWRESWREADRIWGHQSATGEMRLRKRAEMLVQLADLARRAARVLELGSGTGRYTEVLAKAGCEVTAVDLMPEFVKETRKRLKLLRLSKALKSPKVLRADIKRLPFGKDVFDVVVGNSVLHHVIPLEEGLAEIFRVLKPGGKIAFTEPNMLNPHIFLQKNVPFLKKMAGDSPQETAFVRWVVAGQLKKQGFVGVKVEPFDFVYPFLPAGLAGVAERLGMIFEKVPVVREIGGSLTISGQKPKR